MKNGITKINSLYIEIQREARPKSEKRSSTNYYDIIFNIDF